MRNRRPYKRTLTLNKENKKFLGVCAGIADYLEVEPWTVRLIFLASLVFGGWFLVPLYFIAWFCLDDKAGEGIANLAESQPLKHFRTVDYRKKLYRNTEDAKFLGVCAGVADYLEVNVFAVRLFFLALVFFTAALPLFLYFGAYFILEEKPHKRMRQSSDDRRKTRKERAAARKAAGASAARKASGTKSTGDESYTSTPGAAYFNEDVDAEEVQANDSKKYSKRREFKYCARKFAILQDRLAKMEAYVTSSQFRLHREFKNI